VRDGNPSCPRARGERGRGADSSASFIADGSPHEGEGVERCQGLLPRKNARAGQLTASGEPYDPNDLTAASHTLPIGSSVVVANPTTGRSAKLRINDRSPYIRGRSLDL